MIPNFILRENVSYSLTGSSEMARDFNNSKNNVPVPDSFFRILRIQQKLATSVLLS